MIRIIAGKYRHREIYQPQSDKVRPSKDIVRSAVFSALGPISDMDVLDLFSGSGAYGLESLSRDAKSVVFIDSLALSQKTLSQTIAKLQIPRECYEQRLGDYKQEIRKLQGRKFDLIFADPPYEMKITKTLLNMLIELELLNDDARIIIESDNEPEEHPLFQVKKYKYGIAHIGIYRRID